MRGISTEGSSLVTKEVEVAAVVAAETIGTATITIPGTAIGMTFLPSSVAIPAAIPNGETPMA